MKPATAWGLTAAGISVVILAASCIADEPDPGMDTGCVALAAAPTRFRPPAFTKAPAPHRPTARATPRPRTAAPVTRSPRGHGPRIELDLDGDGC